MKRLLTAAIAIPILLFAIWSSQPYLFFAVAVVAILLAVHELFHIAEESGVRPFRWIGYVASTAVLAVDAFLRPEAALIVLVAATVALTFATLTMADEKERALASVGVTVFAVLYVAVCGGYLVAIRAFGDAGLAARLLTLFLTIMMMSDAGAYYAGRAFGSHKLAPRISPGKTIEGSVGGVVAGVVGAVASIYVFFPELPILDAIVLGVVLNVLGQVGDLFESLFKRGAGVKDSSGLLPGHGGFLDRLDSLLPTAPVLYYYYLYVLAPRLGAP